MVYDFDFVTQLAPIRIVASLICVITTAYSYLRAAIVTAEP
jgi:hypothetical protein